MRGVQTPQLHHQEEPPERPGPAGAEEVLPELRQAPGASRDALITSGRLVEIDQVGFRAVPLTANIVGMHYRYPDYYEVEREKIREYASAVQNGDPWFFDEDAAAELGYKGLLAPLTFCCVFGYQA